MRMATDSVDAMRTTAEMLSQPGCSGTGGKSGVALSTPGSVPAACLPTPQEGGRQDAGKLQSPGLRATVNEAGGHTAATARQNADEHNEMETDDRQEANENDMDMGFLGSLEPSVNDVISDLLLQQLGSCGKSYQRERRSAGRRIISEMYSPPRVTEELRKMKHKHLLPGFALDLTVVDPEDGLPWDFSKSGKREKARQMRRRQKPYLLIGSPGR